MEMTLKDQQEESAWQGEDEDKKEVRKNNLSYAAFYSLGIKFLSSH